MVIMVGRVADAQVRGLVGFTLTCENSCMGYFEFVSLFACILPFFLLFSLLQFFVWLVVTFVSLFFGRVCLFGFSSISTSDPDFSVVILTVALA